MRPGVLPIGLLQRKGLLGPQASAARELDIDTKIRVHPQGSQRLDITLIIEFGRIDPVTNRRSRRDSTHVHRIGYVFRKRKFGPRPYFVCPVTGKDCLNLFIYGNLSASEEGLRQMQGGINVPSIGDIRYAKIRARLIGRHGKRPLTLPWLQYRWLLRQPWRLEHDPELATYLNQLVRPDARALKRERRKNRALSTSDGIESGQEACEEPVFLAYLDKAAQGRQEILALRDDFAARHPPDSIEAYPALDIKDLLERGWFEGDVTRAWSLGWPAIATEGHHILVIEDRRDPATPLLVACIQHPNRPEPLWQQIRLIPGPRSDRPRFMECPVRKRPTEILYLRGGQFASRQAQRLHNPSQRAPAKAARGKDM